MLLDHLQRDTRHAVRRLVRDWQFSLAAVLILGLGIGANTAAFSLVNTALFRGQPFADQDGLVEIYQNRGETRSPTLTSFPAYRDIADYTDIFSGVSAFLLDSVTYRADEGLRPAVVEYATSSHLSVLGLRPALGRWFSPDEDLPGPEAVAVVGHRAWRTRFASDPAILGQTMRMNGVPVTIVGVGPDGYHSTLNAGIVTDFWLSTGSISSVEAFTLPPGLLDKRRELAFLVKARLREGVTIAQARAAMSALGDRLAKEFPDADPGRGISVFRFTELWVHPEADRALLPVASALLTIVGLVLAIACTNLATLLLIRGSSRSKEVSVRLALGASRAQLVRHLLTENVLLTIAGGAAGFGLAYTISRGVATLDLPMVLDLSLDYRVLGYTMALSVVTGLAFGLAPALKATRVDLIPSLRDEGGTLSLGRRRFGLTNSLVVFQVGVSFLLLFGTGTLARLIIGAGTIDVGFAVDGVAILETDARYAGYTGQAARQLHQRLLERVRAIPGVDAAVLSNGAPIDGFTGNRRVVADGGSGPSVAISWKWAGPDYFKTLRVGVLFGREFDARDRLNTPAAALINETMAQRLFGTVNAVGRRFRFDDDPASWTEVEVVGVVQDTRTHISLDEPPGPLFYRSITQSESPAPTIMAHTLLDAASLAGAMQRELRALDPQVPVISATTMRQRVDDSMSGERILASILGGLSLLGLALAALGLYAVVAFGVSRRAMEVGIRMALGARGAQVIRLITRDVAAVVGAGIAAGVFLSALVAIWLETTGLSAAANLAFTGPIADIATIAAVAIVMVAIACAAAFFPTRKATRIDPQVALRHR